MEKKKKSWARGEIASKKIFFDWGNCHRRHPREEMEMILAFYILFPLLYFSQLRANNNRKKEIREKECWKVRQQAIKKNKTLRSKSLSKN